MGTDELLLSLSVDQRKAIADIIRKADIEGCYVRGDEGSIWQEDAGSTLDALARYFESYDPESALEHR